MLDERFAATMRAHIERGIADGVPVRAEEFAHIGWLRRATADHVVGVSLGNVGPDAVQQRDLIHGGALFLGRGPY